MSTDSTPPLAQAPAAPESSSPQRTAGAASGPPRRPRWATRTLMGIGWVVLGVLGITTLNGYAASGFTYVPNVFNQVFGSIVNPVPKAPPGFVAVTPAKLIYDFESAQPHYLGLSVSVYGKIIPWEDQKESRVDSPEVNLRGLRGREGTFNIALYADPEEHPELAAKPLVIGCRVGDAWLKDPAHEGLQGQWVQVLGQVVAYAPGGGAPTPEIQVSDLKTGIRPIQEPADIYDHNVPIKNPREED